MLSLSPSKWAQPNSELSRLMSLGHHISMEHRLQKKHLQLNSDTNASNKTYLKEKLKKRRNFLGRKKKWKKRSEKHESGVIPKWAISNHLSTEVQNSIFPQRKIDIFTVRTSQRFLLRCFVQKEKTCGDRPNEHHAMGVMTIVS